MRHAGQRRHASSSALLVLALCLAAGVPAHAARGLDLSGFNLDVAFSSDYVVHGVTRSQGDPSVQGHVGWVGESGLMAGTWLATVNLNPGPGPTLEIDPYLAKRWLLGEDWALRTDATRYLFRKRLADVPYDYTELRSALSFRDIFDVAVAWAPDYSGFSYRGFARQRTMLTYEAGAHFPATRWLALNVGVGRRDMQEAYDASYWYWSGGAETTLDRWSFALTYIGTDNTARQLYGGEYAGHRVVATLALRLR